MLHVDPLLVAEADQDQDNFRKGTQIGFPEVPDGWNINHIMAA
jgi:hypothetical protein